jgi:hypothetical protein
MAKTTVGSWDTTAANNTDLNSIGIQGTNLVSNFDNALRELMAQLKTFQTNLYIGHTAQLAVANTDALQVIGTTTASFGMGLLAFSATGSAQGHLDFYKSASGVIGTSAVVASGDAIGAINWYAAQDATLANFARAAQIRVEIDGTPGVTDMPGRMIFSVSPDGSGTVAEQMRIASTGLITIAAGQIAFPATQNPSAGANTFDDYEEGSFTPAMTFNSSATGVTFSVQAGFYTKVGNRVLFEIQITLTSNGSGVGNNEITGLPFTVLAVNRAAAVTPLSGFSGLTAGATALLIGSTTTLWLYGPNTTGATRLTDTNVTDTAAFHVVGHYAV